MKRKMTLLSYCKYLLFCHIKFGKQESGLKNIKNNLNNQSLN